MCHKATEACGSRYESCVYSAGGGCCVRRCAFDMHHRYTINISGLGWRLPFVSIACDCNRWSPRFSQAPPPPWALPHRCQAPIPPPPPSLNNHQQRPCPVPLLPLVVKRNTILPLFNPLLLLLSSPPSSSWGPPSPPSWAPITQHLWGSHREKIRPFHSSLSRCDGVGKRGGGGGGQVEQRERKRMETLGILDSCFIRKAISSLGCHIWKRQGEEKDREWLHSEAEKRK